MLPSRLEPVIGIGECGGAYGGAGVEIWWDTPALTSLAPRCGQPHSI